MLEFDPQDVSAGEQIDRLLVGLGKSAVNLFVYGSSAWLVVRSTGLLEQSNIDVVTEGVVHVDPLLTGAGVFFAAAWQGVKKHLMGQISTRT